VNVIDVSHTRLDMLHHMVSALCWLVKGIDSALKEAHRRIMIANHPDSGECY
jgi:hypothetical protein